MKRQIIKYLERLKRFKKTRNGLNKIKPIGRLKVKFPFIERILLHEKKENAGTIKRSVF